MDFQSSRVAGSDGLEVTGSPSYMKICNRSLCLRSQYPQASTALPKVAAEPDARSQCLFSGAGSLSTAGWSCGKMDPTSFWL